MDDRIEFIKNALTYLEKRIAVLDTKASILAAVLLGFLATIFNLSKEPNYLLLYISLILALVAIFLLLMTIRPTWKLKISPNTKNGQKLRLKGLGARCPCCDHKGDPIVAINYS